MRGTVSWLLAFLLGLLLGWGGRALRERSDPSGAVVAMRAGNVLTARTAFQRQPSRANLTRLIRALLYQRDACSVARYPEGDDAHRYELAPEVVRLLTGLDTESVTRAERREWRLLYHHAFNPPPEEG